MLNKVALSVLVIALVGCGSVDNQMGTGGSGGAVDATGGSGGMSIEVEADPTCAQIAQGIPPCGPTSPSGPCHDARLPCQKGGGTCIGSVCCMGCVDSSGKCVAGSSTSACGGSGYNCASCSGSTSHCTLDSDGMNHVCSSSSASPPLGEVNNTTCTSTTQPICTSADAGTMCVDGRTACSVSGAGSGACVGTYCCLGCIDSNGLCRTGDSAGARGRGGVSCGS